MKNLVVGEAFATDVEVCTSRALIYKPENRLYVDGHELSEVTHTYKRLSQMRAFYLRSSKNRTSPYEPPTDGPVLAALLKALHARLNLSWLLVLAPISVVE
jgi:hypothetical protein